MVPADIRRHREAIEWVRRLHDPQFADWDAHIAWLEASPANGALFDTVSLRLEALSAGLGPAGERPAPEAPLPPANDVEPIDASVPKGGWRRSAPAVGLGVAAALVAAVSLPGLMRRDMPPARFSTRPGEQRAVRLADGTRVALNGDTAVEIDRSDPRQATVSHGEALFTVVHDAGRPFTVHAGGSVFQDVGTVFDVARAGGYTDVAVREGAVLFDPAGSKIRVDAGHAVRFAGGGVSPSLRAIAANGVGGWSVGRLAYTDAPIDEVAADMERATGLSIAVDPAVRVRRFSGVIMLDRDGARLAKRVSAATGLIMRQDGSGWRIASPHR